LVISYTHPTVLQHRNTLTLALIIFAFYLIVLNLTTLTLDLTTLTLDLTTLT